MMRRCRATSGGVALLALLAVLAPAAAPAQEIEPLSIHTIEGNLFMEARQRTEDRTRSGTRFSQDDLLIKEGLNLDLAGYAYHPNLLDWSTSLRIGASQQWTTHNEEDRDAQGTLLGYNLAGQFFKEKPLSIRAYARGANELVDRSFARSIEVDNHTQGALFSLKGATPATFLVEHRRRHEISEQRIDEEETYQGRFTLTDMRNPDRYTRLSLDHESVDRTNSFAQPDGSQIVQDLPDQRDEVNLTNRWLFGDGEHEHQLSGGVRAVHRRGFFDNDLFNIYQQLDLQHSDTLSSFHRLQFNLDESGDQYDRTLAGETGFRKQVYESLDIIGRLNIEDRQFEDGSEQTVGGALDLDYRKNTPIGVYRSYLTVGREYRQQEFEGGLRPSRDEAVTLIGINRVRLAQPGIVPNTVVVTDARNQVIYREGIDYRLSQFGAFTEITRLAGGEILEGETVLVDYLAATGPASDFFTDTFASRHRIDLKHLPLAFYGHYYLNDQTLDGGFDPGNLERQQSILGGVELRVTQEVLLSTEYEMRRLDLTPDWNAWRARAGYHRSLGSRASLVASLDYEMLRYLDAASFGLEPGRDFLETLFAGVQVTSKLTDHLLLRGTGSYRITRGRQRDRLTRVGGSLIWQYGRTEASLDGFFDMWEQEEDDGTRSLIGISVKRYF